MDAIGHFRPHFNLVPHFQRRNIAIKAIFCCLNL